MYQAAGWNANVHTKIKQWGGGGSANVHLQNKHWGGGPNVHTKNKLWGANIRVGISTWGAWGAWGQMSIYTFFHWGQMSWSGEQTSGDRFIVVFWWHPICILITSLVKM